MQAYPGHLNAAAILSTLGAAGQRGSLLRGVVKKMGEGGGFDEHG